MCLFCIMMTLIIIITGWFGFELFTKTKSSYTEYYIPRNIRVV